MSLKYFFTFEGRVKRLRYFGCTVFATLLALILEVLASVFGISSAGEEAYGTAFMSGGILFLVFILLVWMQLSFAARRARDTGTSPWIVLAFFIPIANVIVGLYLLFKGSKVADDSSLTPTAQG